MFGCLQVLVLAGFKRSSFSDFSFVFCGLHGFGGLEFGGSGFDGAFGGSLYDMTPPRIFMVPKN